MKQKASLKRVLWIFVPIVITAFAVTWFMLHTSLATEIKALRFSQQHTVSQQVQGLKHDIADISRVLMSMAESRNVRELWGPEGELRPQVLARLGRDFLTISGIRKQFDQIRLLDERGMERVRVNFRETGPWLVSESELQNKKGRYYFDDAFRLEQGQVFVSPLDLNVEHGKVEVPLKPMIRFATPVFDDYGTKRGIMLLNYFGRELLARFSDHDSSVEGSVSMILNPPGYWLKGPVAELEWGFMLEHRKQHTFGATYPDVWASVKSNDHGQVETAAGLFTFETVHPVVAGQLAAKPTADSADGPRLSSSEEAYSWKVISFLPANVLYADHNRRIRIAGLALALLSFFVLLIARLIVRSSLRQAEAEKFLADILDSLPGVVFKAEMPRDGGVNYSFISSGVKELLGYTTEDLQVNPVALFRAVHAEDFSTVYGKLYHSASTLEPFRVEYRIIKKGGDYLWVREIARPLRAEDGGTIWNGLILDISDLKETEQQLEVHYSALNAANDSVLIADPEGAIEWVNQSLIAFSGLPEQRLLGRPICDFLDDQCASKPDVISALQNHVSWQGEVIYRHPNNDLYTVDLSLTPVLDDSGQIRHFISIIRDLSERKALETQLLAAQKMESIGQLAAGIAHEINTPTQFVGDNVSFLKDVVADYIATLEQLQQLKRRLSDQTVDLDQVAEIVSAALEQADVEFIIEEAPAAIEQSQDGLGRIARIVGAMKDFSHPGSKGMEQVNLNHIIETTVTIARNEWKYVADLEMQLADDLPSIRADSQLIGQSILNFIVNAAHAISERFGEVGDKGLIKISTQMLDGCAEMRIADNGAGIPEEIRQHIFEPFFTTKEVGKGSGQGLAIAYSGIIDKHKGSIDVESTVGEGTTFIVALPLDDASSEEAA